MCVYCERNPGTTRDHVPPQGWFTAAERRTMRVITVLSCRRCNQAQGAAEEEFRNVLAMLRGRAAAEVYERFQRSLIRQPGSVLRSSLA